MSIEGPIVALEIGTSKVRALVAQARDDDHLLVIGLGECPSRGVRKSEISDFENALSCARVALQNAEESADVNIGEVNMLLSGGHIQSTINRGSIPVLKESREITRDDVVHVMEAAEAIHLPEDREVLHTINQQFYVDGQRGVINPVGLEGGRLETDMLIVHGVRSRLRNTLNVARNARVDVRHVAFSGLCAALAVLTPADKQNGVLVIDLGGGTTSYVVYAAGMIAAAGCLALGGDHLTNDVARGFSITQVQAESLKEAYGSAEIDLAARAQKLDVKNDSGASRRPVRLGDLQLITSMRAAEILELVRSEIRPELLGHLGAGVVLTGGGAHLRNMTALGAKTFGMPCQLGKARDVSGIAMATSGTAYAAPLGLLRYAVRTGYRDEERVSLSGIIKKILGMG